MVIREEMSTHRGKFTSIRNILLAMLPSKRYLSSSIICDKNHYIAARGRFLIEGQQQLLLLEHACKPTTAA
jgi:hypothetical protein